MFFFVLREILAKYYFYLNYCGYLGHGMRRVSNKNG